MLLLVVFPLLFVSCFAMLMHEEGGYGTKAGHAKNEWAQFLRRFAAANGVKYGHVMKNSALMDAARKEYYGNPPPVKKRQPKQWVYVENGVPIHPPGIKLPAGQYKGKAYVRKRGPKKQVTFVQAPPSVLQSPEAYLAEQGIVPKPRKSRALPEPPWGEVGSARAIPPPPSVLQSPEAYLAEQGIVPKPRKPRKSRALPEPSWGEVGSARAILPPGLIAGEQKASVYEPIRTPAVEPEAHAAQQQYERLKAVADIAALEIPTLPPPQVFVEPRERGQQRAPQAIPTSTALVPVEEGSRPMEWEAGPAPGRLAEEYAEQQEAEQQAELQQQAEQPLQIEYTGPSVKEERKQLEARLDAIRDAALEAPEEHKEALQHEYEVTEAQLESLGHPGHRQPIAPYGEQVLAFPEEVEFEYTGPAVKEETEFPVQYTAPFPTGQTAQQVKEEIHELAGVPPPPIAPVVEEKRPGKKRRAEQPPEAYPSEQLLSRGRYAEVRPEKKLAPNPPGWGDLFQMLNPVDRERMAQAMRESTPEELASEQHNLLTTWNELGRPKILLENLLDETNARYTIEIPALEKGSGLAGIRGMIGAGLWDKWKDLGSKIVTKLTGGAAPKRRRMYYR